MTTEKRTVKILLLHRNMTFSDLAAQADLALATVHNSLDGKTANRKSKQAITNALGVEIWPGITPAKRPYTFHEGTEIELPAPDEKWMSEALIEYAGFVERTGEKVLRFIKPAPVFIDTNSRNLQITLQSPHAAAVDSKHSASARGKRTRTPKAKA